MNKKSSRPSKAKLRSGSSGKTTTRAIISTGRWQKRVTMPNLKPTTQSISLRLPISLREDIKVAANSRDVPYQSLIKIWLSEKIHEAL